MNSKTLAVLSAAPSCLSAAQTPFCRARTALYKDQWPEMDEQPSALGRDSLPKPVLSRRGSPVGSELQL